MFFDIVEDPEIEFSGDSKVLFTSSLLLLTNFCFNYYLDNNLTTFFLISMPLWISLLFYFLSENIRKIPLQDDVQKKKIFIKNIYKRLSRRNTFPLK